MTTGDWKKSLYFGDNLDILRERIADESVDLIYLDPPFNSNATYNVLFQERSGDDSVAQSARADVGSRGKARCACSLSMWESRSGT